MNDKKVKKSSTIPFFSIIIPTYNSGETLAQTLQSIARQSFTDFEVWIIDGQSTDNTLAIARTFQPEIPQLHIVSEPDKGIYDAMNKGIDKAQGRWLYFLGSDDYFYDNEVLKTVFKATNRLDLSNKLLLYGNVVFVGKEDGTIYDGVFDTKKILHKNICHQACFYKKEVFDLIGKYNTGIPLYADYDMNLKIFGKYKHKTGYIDTLVAYYNTLGVSGTQPDKDNFFEHKRWHTIIQSFKYRILSKPFIKYHKQISRQKKYFGTFDIYAQTALLLYLIVIRMPYYLKSKING